MRETDELFFGVDDFLGWPRLLLMCSNLTKHIVPWTNFDFLGLLSSVGVTFVLFFPTGLAYLFCCLRCVFSTGAEVASKR